MTVDHARDRSVRLMHHDASERPFIVIWEVTRACQLACSHCRADAIRFRDPGELSTEEGRRLLDDLASFGAPRPLVVLTGGDPFERPDLAELVAHGTSLGLSVALSPSVTARLTRPVLVELHDAGAKAVSLSLDGATAGSHDSFRRVDGVFDATLAAARTIREIGFRLQINTTVTRGNVRELPRILQHVVDLGASLWSVFFLVPTGRGKDLEPLAAAEEEEILHWLHDVSALVAIGEIDRARMHCEKLIGVASTLGLYGEELDPSTGRHLGNFPQALTHLALINAILGVINAEDRGGASSVGSAKSHSWWNAGKTDNSNTIAAREIWPDPTNPSDADAGKDARQSHRRRRGDRR